MTVNGIDISQWQGTTPDLAGLSFVIVKATYGTGRDPRYTAHAANVRKAKLALGAYTFGVNADGAAQAKALLSVAKDADFYALDLEGNGADSMTGVQAKAFIDAVHKAGCKIGLYHSKSNFPNLGQDWNWIAAWDGVDPGTGWTFHQYRGAPLDLDVFNGDAAALAAFVAGQCPKGGSVPDTQPTPLTPAAEPVVYAGIITSLLVAAGLVTSGEAATLTPALVALIAVIPTVISLISRQFVTPNRKVPTPVTVSTSTSAAIPVVTVTPVARSVPVLTVVSSVNLPAGTEGNIPAVTRRWAEDGEQLGTIGPSILGFDREVVLAGPINGTFWHTSTTPPVYVIKADVTPVANSTPVTAPVPPAPDPVLATPVTAAQATSTLARLALLPPVQGEYQHTYAPAMNLAQWLDIEAHGAQLPNGDGQGLHIAPGQVRNPFDKKTITTGLTLAYQQFRAGYNPYGATPGLTPQDLADAQNSLAIALEANDYAAGPLGPGFADASANAAAIAAYRVGLA